MSAAMYVYDVLDPFVISLATTWPTLTSFDFSFFKTEFFLLILCMYHLLISINQTTPNRLRIHLVELILTFIVAAGLTIFTPLDTNQIVFNGLFYYSTWYVFSKLVLIGFFCFVVAGSYAWLVSASRIFYPHAPIKVFEYPFFLTLMLLFMLCFFLSFDFITLYLAFEGISLILMILVLFNITSFKASEAAVKYFCLSVFTSGLFIFGVSLLYGLVGSTSFFDVRNFVEAASTGLHEPHRYYLILAVSLILSSFLFKLGAAPYHLWVGEVYEGTETPITIIFMVPVKFVFFSGLVKLVAYVFLPYPTIWQPFLLVFTTLSLILGALSASTQDNIKKFFAVASINQVGFLLLALLSNPGSLQAVYAHLFTYLAATTIIFIVLLAVNSAQASPGVVFMSDLQNIYLKTPVLAYCLAIAVLSMAGLPPLLGFFSKYAIFRDALDASVNFWIIIVAFATNLLSAFYYVRVLKNTFWTQNKLHDGRVALSRVVLGLLIPLVSFLLVGFVWLDALWVALDPILFSLGHPFSVSLDTLLDFQEHWLKIGFYITNDFELCWCAPTLFSEELSLAVQNLLD